MNTYRTISGVHRFSESWRVSWRRWIKKQLYQTQTAVANPTTHCTSKLDVKSNGPPVLRIVNEIRPWRLRYSSKTSRGNRQQLPKGILGGVGAYLPEGIVHMEQVATITLKIGGRSTILSPTPLQTYSTKKKGLEKAGVIDTRNWRL